MRLYFHFTFSTTMSFNRYLSHTKKSRFKYLCIILPLHKNVTFSLVRHFSVLSDNLTVYAGKSVYTFGVAYEGNEFKNGFAPNYYGGYQFPSFDAFYASVNNKVSTAGQFRQQWSNTSAFPFAYMKGSTLSLYAQDELSLGKGLKVKVGFVPTTSKIIFSLEI